MDIQKGTFEDWANGGELIHEYIITSLKQYRELKESDIDKIREMQKTAWIDLIYKLLYSSSMQFLFKYWSSLVREPLLRDAINSAKEEIELFKNNYQEIYRETLDGKDGKNYLSFEQVTAINNNEIYNPINRHMSLTVKLMYLEWLYWFEKTDNEWLKSDVEGYYESHKKNYFWPNRDAFERVKSSLSKLGKNEPISYNWISNPNEELPKLYQGLIATQLIHPDTTFEQLKAVFTSKPLQAIEPINWIGAKNLLAYFLDCIQKHKIPTNTNVWSIAERCFVNADSLAQSKTNYENSKRGTPKQSDIIDEILNTLK
jgi:hypothetical protein